MDKTEATFAYINAISPMVHFSKHAWVSLSLSKLFPIGGGFFFLLAQKFIPLSKQKKSSAEGGGTKSVLRAAGFFLAGFCPGEVSLHWQFGFPPFVPADLAGM